MQKDGSVLVCVLLKHLCIMFVQCCIKNKSNLQAEEVELIN